MYWDHSFLKWFITTFFSKKILGLSVLKALDRSFFWSFFGYFKTLSFWTVWYFLKTSSGTFSPAASLLIISEVHNFCGFKVFIRIFEELTTFGLIIPRHEYILFILREVLRYIFRDIIVCTVVRRHDIFFLLIPIYNKKNQQSASLI